jgi:hypothetical protein
MALAGTSIPFFSEFLNLDGYIAHAHNLCHVKQSEDYLFDLVASAKAVD